MSAGIALITGDLDGNIWMDDLAAEWLAVPTTTPVVPVENWAAAFHCYDPVTRMPIMSDRLPAVRALREGSVQAEVLLAPPDGREVVVQVCANPLTSQNGDVLGVLVSMRDITEQWLEHVGACGGLEIEMTINICPCEAWSVEAPVGTPLIWVQEAVLEHMRECIVLAATRVAATSPAASY